jgi:hypothetical protein
MGVLQPPSEAASPLVRRVGGERGVAAPSSIWISMLCWLLQPSVSSAGSNLESAGLGHCSPSQRLWLLDFGVTALFPFESGDAQGLGSAWHKFAASCFLRSDSRF